MPTALRQRPALPSQAASRRHSAAARPEALEQRALELLVFASLAAAFWAIARAARAPGVPGNWHTLREVGTTSPLPEVGNGYGSRNRRSCPGLTYGPETDPPRRQEPCGVAFRRFFAYLCAFLSLGGVNGPQDSSVNTLVFDRLCTFIDGRVLN
jgi:hypothetical protein